MIKAENLTKKFDGFTALNQLSCSIPDGCVYGLVGSNGAGKSTFLRLVSGIYKPDGGSVAIDGVTVYDNPDVKKRFVFVPDELYFLPQSSMERMAKLYASVFPGFDKNRYGELVQTFGLDPKANLNTFSKGMRRQAATILALSCMADYIFFDETFDGLDPVIRNLVRKILYNDVCERNSAAVITSHSLRELEDTCDQLALLHKGGIVFESDVQNLKTSLFKVQVAFNADYDKSLFEGLNIMNFSKKGSVANIILRGGREEAVRFIKSKQPVLFEILPLSLEEVFIYEMDALGYAFRDILN